MGGTYQAGQFPDKDIGTIFAYHILKEWVAINNHFSQRSSFNDFSAVSRGLDP